MWKSAGIVDWTRIFLLAQLSGIWHWISIIVVKVRSEVQQQEDEKGGDFVCTTGTTITMATSMVVEEK